MDSVPGTTDTGQQESDTRGDNLPVGSNGRTPTRKTRKYTPRKSTRKPKPETAPTASPQAQAQDILETPPSPGLSEEEIETLLKEFPTPSPDTPIPQAPTSSDFTSAAIILTLIDGMVQMALGPQYAMTKEERRMMAEPLDRIMARFPSAQIAQYSQFVDPLLLLMGLIGWGSRIMRMRAEEQKAKQIEKPQPGKPTNIASPPAPPVDQQADELMSVPPEVIQLGAI